MDGEDEVAVDEDVDLDRFRSFLARLLRFLRGFGLEVAVEGEDDVLGVGVELPRRPADVTEC